MDIHSSLDDQFLRKIHQLIEDNLDNEHFSVEDLAQQTSLSRSMLHRKLIKLTGKSASDLITERRLIKAKELLENNVATAAEIAYKVGFSSPSYFNKVFKSHFQVSPGDVRKGNVKILPALSSTQPHEIRNVSRKKIRSLSIIILVVLLTLAAAVTGIYYFLRNDKPSEKSIAILPFDDISSEKKSQYFADGIVEDLLNRISKIEGLKVISRTSSEMFRNKGNKSVPEIARILGVSYILEGTVQQESDQIRINIQLIDARMDNHVLSKQYDRNLSEVFTIQSEIAGQIASELSLVLTNQQVNALKKNKTKNLKAFEFYQMGRFQSNRRWIEGYNKSIEYYEKAIAEDPGYGLAYAGLADTYHLMALQGWMDRKEGKDKAVELALKALELDPDLAEAHTVLASLYMYVDWNWKKSEKEFLQALKLNPNYSTALFYYSCLLFITSRTDKARKQINRAMELDPFSFVMRNFSGRFYYNQGQFKEALAENKLSLDLIKDHEWSVRFDFDIYYHLGMDQEAIESFKRYGRLFNKYDPAIADSVYKNEGLDGLLRVKIKAGSAYRAGWYAMLGENEKALDVLEKLCADRIIDPVLLTTGYDFRYLHDNPRYINILKKMGLYHYQVQTSNE
jgi:TolB-like protein/AraC-like DNA-binding protein